MIDSVSFSTVLEGLASLRHFRGGGLASIVGLSLASAASYGLAAVLQHYAAIREIPDLSRRGGLVVRLVRRPMWLVGSALDGVGYLFQFLALRRGSLTLVEPLLVLSLVFALPVAARLDRRLASRTEMLSSLVVVAGLILFLTVARPGVGRPHASAGAWIILSAVIAAFCALAALGARGNSKVRAAVLFAVGSGAAFGYVAAVTERTGHVLDRGALHTLATWTPYALVVGGAVALMLTQSAFHAGALRLSLPTLTIAQPLVAISIGLGFFGEHINTAGLAPAFEGLGLALATVGVFALARWQADDEVGHAV